MCIGYTGLTTSFYMRDLRILGSGKRQGDPKTNPCPQPPWSQRTAAIRETENMPKCLISFERLGVQNIKP